MSEKERHYGVLGATSIGVGAIVGGGILVLGGVSIEQTGPSAVLAFALNAGIAFLTAMSVAELATLFPESGGIYSYAKRVLSIRAGFAFGWILWFAHLVAALLYAVGFAAFFAETMEAAGPLIVGSSLPWFGSVQGRFIIGSLVTVYYSYSLICRAGGGSDRENIVKLAVFALLIGGGIYAALSGPSISLADRFVPLFPTGAAGFGMAMGLTFIALQGFETIAGVGGELKDPRRTAPRAMFLSLAVALFVYIPLLFVLVLVGIPQGELAHEWCRARGSGCLPDAARNYMGTAGFWLVLIAALFSTLSALHANLLSASRLIHRMAQDRTMPRFLSLEHKNFGTPSAAILSNLVLLIFLLGLVGTVSLAGSAASLVFLLLYACTHGLSWIARKRSKKTADMFRTPLFPAVPLVGLLLCFALAAFQGVVEPAAGSIVVVWLIFGILLYRRYFSGRAEALDAHSQALRPELIAFRGRQPLVLVPITNPATAPELVGIAHALAANEAGKVMLLKVVNTSSAPAPEELQTEIDSAHEVLNAALLKSYTDSSAPAQALLTLSDSPWREISRVAQHHGCDSLVMGVNRFNAGSIEELLKQLHGDVAILSAPPEWSLAACRRVLVPIGGRPYHDSLRARVLGTLLRAGLDEICLFSVLPEDASEASQRDMLRLLTIRAEEEAGAVGQSRIEKSADAAQTIISVASSYDLLLLGLDRIGPGQMRFGEFASRVAKDAPCATLVIGRGK